MNVFTVVGRLTADSEQRFTVQGNAVFGFAVATDVGFGENRHALYVRCSLWGKRGESLAPHLKKGTPVTVSGEADLRTWESQGKNGAEITLNVRDIALQGGKSTAPQQGFREPPKTQSGAGNEDDVPF